MLCALAFLFQITENRVNKWPINLNYNTVVMLLKFLWYFQENSSLGLLLLISFLLFSYIIIIIIIRQKAPFFNFDSLTVGR